MATTRFKFRASTVSGKQGTLFIQVIHQRVVRQVSTLYRLYPYEWDAGRQSVVIPGDTFPDRIRYLRAVQEALQRDASRLQLIILALGHRRKEYLAEDVIKRFLKKEHSNDFTTFAEMLISRKREQGLTPQNHPFARVYTGIAKTVKRAVNIREVQKIKAQRLPPDSTSDFSRNIFLFSLYTCGMSLTDIAHLKKSNLQGDYLSYCRRKTGQRINIRWEACMQQLVDKYQSDDSPYLLPIITRPGEDEARQYRNKIHLINHHLKKLGEELELSSKLTTYVARHSWACIAKSQDVPVAAISEAMGHTTEHTTRIYLKSFDNTLVDCANRKVLSAIA